MEELGFQNRRTIEIYGLIFPFAPPKLVILRQLEFYREGHSEKHLRDIRGMLSLTEWIVE